MTAPVAGRRRPVQNPALIQARMVHHPPQNPPAPLTVPVHPMDPRNHRVQMIRVLRTLILRGATHPTAIHRIRDQVGVQIRSHLIHPALTHLGQIAQVPTLQVLSLLARIRQVQNHPIRGHPAADHQTQVLRDPRHRILDRQVQALLTPGHPVRSHLDQGRQDQEAPVPGRRGADRVEAAPDRVEAAGVRALFRPAAQHYQTQFTFQLRRQEPAFVTAVVAISRFR